MRKRQHPVLLAICFLVGLELSCPAQEAPATLRTGTKLVVVDVVVRDSTQNRVRDLKREDFTLLEGKVPQKLLAFEEHTSAPPKVEAELPPLPAGTYTNRQTPPRSSAVNVILIDALNTPLKDQIYLRKQMAKYLSEVPPGTNLAVFSLNARLVMLQGFTSDQSILKHALDGAFGEKSVALSNAQETNSPDITIVDTIKELNLDTIIDSNRQMELLNRENRLKAAQTESRASLTLDGLDVLARYLEGIPGRKNLIWFSGAFPIAVLPGGTAKELQSRFYDPFARVTNSERQFRETVNLMARSEVAVYPIDSRGLQVSAAYSTAVNLPDPVAEFKDKDDAFLQTQQDEHFAMERIARETGGQAFFNTNALMPAMRSALDDGAAYYTLTYRPSDTEWNGELRKITVRLAHRGYSLTYRRDYYANDASSPKTALVAAPKDPGEIPHGAVNDSSLTRSMTHGVPAAAQVLYQAHFTSEPGTFSAATAQANLTSTPNFLKVAGPFRKIRIDLNVEPGSLTLLRAIDGSYSALVELVALGYERDGRIVGRSFLQTQLKVSAANYELFSKRAIPLRVDLNMPLNGHYSIRTGILDINSQRVGTLETPFDLVKDLPTNSAELPVQSPTLTPRTSGAGIEK